MGRRGLRRQGRGLGKAGAGARRHRHLERPGSGAVHAPTPGCGLAGDERLAEPGDRFEDTASVSPRIDGEEDTRRRRSEADLRGSLDNDSLSEDEIRQIEADRAKAEAAAQLRIEDYQLAYAIDILTGLNAIGPVK